MGRALGAPQRGTFQNQRGTECGCHLRGLRCVVTVHSGAQTVDRHRPPDCVPSTAGCSLVGMTKPVGLWEDLGAEDAEPGSLPAQLTLTAVSPLPCLSPAPCPVFFPQDHIPVPYQPDSSSNPSSTTSSTPSSPAPPLPPSATPPSPLHPSPQCTRQQKAFNLPGTSTLGEPRGVLGSCQGHFGAGPCLKARGRRHVDRVSGAGQLPRVITSLDL